MSKMSVSHVRRRDNKKKSTDSSPDKGLKDKIFSLLQTYPMFNNPSPDNVPFRVVQSYENTGAYSSSTTLPTFFAASFNIANLDQVGTLTALFDQYRIVEVEVWLLPRFADNSSTSVNPGLTTSVIDYDDGTALTTVPAALDYQNALTAPSTLGHYRKFKPHIAVAGYTGSFTGYTNLTSPWIDCATTNVQHYGLKTATTVTSSSITFDLLTRLHLEWRNVR
jgi:hypothetical protein